MMPVAVVNPRVFGADLTAVNTNTAHRWDMPIPGTVLSFFQAL